MDLPPHTAPGMESVGAPAPQLEPGLQSPDRSGPSGTSQGVLELLQEYHRQNMEQKQQLIGLLTETRERQREFHNDIHAMKQSMENMENILSQMLFCKQLQLAREMAIPVTDLQRRSRLQVPGVAMNNPLYEAG